MIQYRQNPSLPSLAWIATVQMRSGDVNVTHGCLVETQPEHFFEGAWAGDFAAGRLGDTEVIFGSGATLVPDGVLFVPSLATTDYLFYKQTPDKVVVANSLALLLGALGDELNPAFPGYADVNNSILLGIDEYERRIPSRAGFVSRLIHNNLHIDQDGPEEVAKPEPPPFQSFDDYSSYLSSSYLALVENARDSRRHAPLQIYSTQSRGYDSTAVNSIAAKHGLDGVFTVKTGKAGGAFSDESGEPEINDDGTEIARTLGVDTILPLDRRAFESDYTDEVYYHASIHEPQDANLKQITQQIVAPALLLTGTLGELWYTNELGYKNRPDCLKPDLRRWDLSLHGLTEPRIRAGFIQVAVPYIGARRRADILRITESSDMDPWRLGTTYDRPIPRRLAESAGVPRSAFGHVKIGSVVEFTPPQIPQSAPLRQAYFSFLRREGLRSGARIGLFPLIHRFNQTVWFASETRHRVVYYSRRLASKLLRRELRPSLLWSDLRGSTYCFAVNQCVDEYAKALQEP
ncbi:MAG: hypothetical protein ACR2GG_02590 [Gemmatimonadaceae bacterium]